MFSWIRNFNVKIKQQSPDGCVNVCVAQVFIVKDEAVFLLMIFSIIILKGQYSNSVSHGLSSHLLCPGGW